MSGQLSQASPIPSPSVSIWLGLFTSVQLSSVLIMLSSSSSACETAQPTSIAGIPEQSVSFPDMTKLPSR